MASVAPAGGGGGAREEADDAREHCADGARGLHDAEHHRQAFGKGVRVQPVVRSDIPFARRALECAIDRRLCRALGKQLESLLGSRNELRSRGKGLSHAEVPLVSSSYSRLPLRQRYQHGPDQQRDHQG